MPGAVSVDQGLPVAEKPQVLAGVIPDRVGEELADDARIWRVYDAVAKQNDAERIVDWNRGLDNLALFTTLFSAVTTAFLLEARNDMKPDYAELSFLVLIATNHGNRFEQKPFVLPTSARAVNCLWTASLILSLLAALISVMGKEWLAMYTSRPECNPRQWAELRAYRTRCIERWYMPHIIASAQPLLLHASFVLFLAGLIIFISPDPFAHNLTLGLSLFAGLVYVVTVLGAIVCSDSPFKSPATQSVRTALTLFFLLCRDVLSRPKRNLLPTLQEGINDLVGPGINAIGYLQRLSRRRGLAELFRDIDLPAGAERPRRDWSLMSHLRSCRTGVVAAISATARLPRAAMHKFSWVSILSFCRNLRVGDTFFGTTWTDLPASRRPELIAEALSWLNAVSQSPDVFRAVVFALGDLDIGGQVGRHVSWELRMRLRAEISQSWHTADPLILSRYALAESNLPGDALLDESQFRERFDVDGKSLVRCEDGLAAAIKFPTWKSAEYIARCFPESVSQPRMMEFLRPHLQAEDLILVANHYWAHLRNGAFNLEVELYQRLDYVMHKAYALKVSTVYGKPGPIELLTFLLSRNHMTECTNKAAVELIMHVLESQPQSQLGNPCLAYLFGESAFKDIAWSDRNWDALQLDPLFESLKPSLHHTRPISETPPRFNLVLTRTVVILLAQSRFVSDSGYLRVRFLHTQLCHAEIGLKSSERADIIRLLLQERALSGIADASSDEVFKLALDILTTVVLYIRRLLIRDETFADGERLFAQLAVSWVAEDRGRRDEWGLGGWMPKGAGRLIYEECPSAASALQGIHDAMVLLYPLHDESDALRADWDRMGYPGRPGDVFSDPFLSLRAFFDCAEATPPAASSRRGKTVRWKL